MTSELARSLKEAVGLRPSSLSHRLSSFSSAASGIGLVDRRPADYAQRGAFQAGIVHRQQRQVSANAIGPVEAVIFSGENSLLIPLVIKHDIQVPAVGGARISYFVRFVGLPAHRTAISVEFFHGSILLSFKWNTQRGWRWVYAGSEIACRMPRVTPRGSVASMRVTHSVSPMLTNNRVRIISGKGATCSTCEGTLVQ